MCVFAKENMTLFIYHSFHDHNHRVICWELFVTRSSRLHWLWRCCSSWGRWCRWRARSLPYAPPCSSSSGGPLLLGALHHLLTVLRMALHRQVGGTCPSWLQHRCLSARQLPVVRHPCTASSGRPCTRPWPALSRQLPRCRDPRTDVRSPRGPAARGGRRSVSWCYVSKKGCVCGEW
jgi:hypothetical protein